jgi:hypothetical protein
MDRFWHSVQKPGPAGTLLRQPNPLLPILAFTVPIPLLFSVPLLASSTCICLRPASRLHVTHAALLNIYAVCTVHRPPTVYHREKQTERSSTFIHQRLSAHVGVLGYDDGIRCAAVS